MSIAYNASSAGTASASSLTFSHTCTGSNLVLLVSVSLSNDGVSVSSVKYNNVTMTLIKDQTASTAHTYLYYLIAPSTGSNSVLVTLSGSCIVNASSVSYTGCGQVSQPDNSTKAASYTLTHSVNVGRCWIVATAGAAIGTGLSFVAGSGFTYRNSAGSGGYYNGLEDSNGTVSTGNNTVAMTMTNGTDPYYPTAIVAASILVYQPFFSFVATTQTFAQTLYSAILTHFFNLTATVKTFSMTLYSSTFNWVLNIWKDASKSTSSWSNSTKHTDTFSNDSKSSDSWSNLPKS